MKYLKLFESLNYYTKIGGSEFYDKFFLEEEEVDVMSHPVIEISSCAGHFNYDSIENFSKIEISKIDEVLSYTPFEINKLNIDGIHHVGPSNGNKERDIKLHNGILQITKRKLKPSRRDPYVSEWRDVIYFEIFKCVDEWFYVYQYGINDLFYKCDQLDGLIKFIEDVVLPKRNESKDLGFVIKQPRSFSDKFTIKNVNDFKDKDIERIKSLLNSYDVTDFQRKLPSTVGFWIPYKDIKSTRKYINIESFKDEWFLLTDYPHYYECDQIEGVINCLKTLLPENYIKESYLFKDISGNKYFGHLNDNKVYCFTHDEIRKINSVIKVNPIGASLETSYGGFGIYDQFDLTSTIDSNTIEVNHSNGKKEIYHANDSEHSDYLTDLLNYTLVILGDGDPNKRSTTKTFINKLADEWYIVEHGGDIKRFYKCDQIDGLLSLLKSLYSIKESFISEKNYKEISIDEYNYNLWGEETGDEMEDEKIAKKTVKEKWDYFTDNEIEKINNVGFNFIKDEKTYNKPILSYKPPSTIITIYKLIDDWFYVFFYSREFNWNAKMYKCDQIDGLISLLKDIKNGINPLKESFASVKSITESNSENFEEVKDVFDIKIADYLELEYCYGNIFIDKIKKFGLYEYNITNSYDDLQLDISIRIDTDYDPLIPFEYYIDRVFRESIKYYGYTITNFESPLNDDFYIIQIEKDKSINESFVKKGYYEEIDYEEYKEKIWTNEEGPDENGQIDHYYDIQTDKIEEFTQNEINLISKGKKYEIYKGGGTTRIPYDSLIIDENICITKLNDGWFLVRDLTNNWCFECDQIDGLISCLDKIEEYYD